MYSNADIFLLDDPLSSLHAKVAEHVFKKCLLGLLADRIVLLTTRTSHYLREANYIVKLKRGVIVAQGNFVLMKNEFSDVKVNVDRLNETSDRPNVEYSEIEQHCSSDDIDLNKITKETLQVA